MLNNILYPKEVYSALGRNEIFSVTAHFVPINPNEGLSPYKIYQPKTSRFVFSIVDKQNKTYPYGNIRMDEIPGLIANTKSAHQIDMFARIPVLHQMFAGIKKVNKLLNDVQDGIRTTFEFVRSGGRVILTSEQLKHYHRDNEGSFAKNVVIEKGKLKGKTPYQILVEDATNGIVDLKSQYNWLEKNAEKYPQNKQQMRAIVEALTMYQNGAIQQGDISAGDKLSFGTIPIYSPTPRPLIREKDEKGYCPVYEVAVLWHVGENYPVEIRVKRYKAPVMEQESGAVNPICSEAIDVENNTFRLSISQWMDCIYLMESNMNRFELIHAATQFRNAEEADMANRQAMQN